MKFALTKFRIYLLGSKPFTVFTDHASLRTAIKSPHLSQRMARWLSFFAEYNFSVEYKPGKLNVIADALSRRPDLFEPAKPQVFRADEDPDAEVNLLRSVPQSSSLDDVRVAYTHDDDCQRLISHLSDAEAHPAKSLSERLRARRWRYALENGLLYYRVESDDDWRIVVPHDVKLRQRIMYEYHDSPMSGHLGREKTYLSLSRDFYWSNQYKAVRKYCRACEICQRVKPFPTQNAPLQPLPVPEECWKSVSMDFVFGLPNDNGKSGVLVFVDRFSKMVHFAACSAHVTAVQAARLFVEYVFRLHGMPTDLVSDRDPRFTAHFWREVFAIVGTRLRMSTSDHPQTDGQTERVNRVLEDILRSYAHGFKRWTEHLPMAEFAINNSVHASTGMTPFFVNGLRHPRLPTLLGGSSPLSGGGTQRQSVSASTSNRFAPLTTQYGSPKPTRTSITTSRQVHPPETEADPPSVTSSTRGERRVHEKTPSEQAESADESDIDSVVDDEFESFQLATREDPRTSVGNNGSESRARGTNTS